MVEVTMWTEADLTTDASTNTRATTLAVTPKWQYFRTVPGVLRIIEMFFGLLVCCLANAVQCTYLSQCSAPLDPGYQGAFGGQGFVIFVGVLFLVGNLAWIIAYVFVWQDEKPQWFDLGEFAYICTATLFYFLAACVEAWYASMQRITSLPELNPFRPAWIACAVFAWFNFLIYFAELLLWLSSNLHLLRRSNVVGPVSTDATIRQQSTSGHPSPPTPASKLSSSPRQPEPKEPRVYVVDRNGYHLQTLV